MNKLSNKFQPAKYDFFIDINNKTKTFKGVVAIEGWKLPPPSRRITLNQKGLKIVGAEITRKDKKGDKMIPVTRINHIKSFEEVRIHTEETLYPGQYIINIEFRGRGDNTIRKLVENQDSWKKISWRSILPSIDEEQARTNSEFTASYLNEV